MELLSHIELATGADPQGTVIWMHGLGADGWDFVPISLAQSSRTALAARGLAPEWHDYPMPHSVCAEEVAAISRWLAARYASPILLA